MDEQKRRLYRGTLCVVEDWERYLMRQETEGINKGLWIFPGGSYKLTENEARTEFGIECAARETQEETGIIPLNLQLRAIIYFDNRKRIFPGKTEIADFDYQAFYFYSNSHKGAINPINQKGTQVWLPFADIRKHPMHEGDLKILDALEKMPENRIFEGVIVHNRAKLETADFSLI